MTRRLTVTFRNLKLIRIHMRKVFHAKSVRVIIFCAIFFSTFCDTYAVYREYIGLPKRVKIFMSVAWK